MELSKTKIKLSVIVLGIGFVFLYIITKLTLNDKLFQILLTIIGGIFTTALIQLSSAIFDYKRKYKNILIQMEQIGSHIFGYFNLLEHDAEQWKNKLNYNTSITKDTFTVYKNISNSIAAVTEQIYKEIISKEEILLSLYPFIFVTRKKTFRNLFTILSLQRYLLDIKQNNILKSTMEILSKKIQIVEIEYQQNLTNQQDIIISMNQYIFEINYTLQNLSEQKKILDNYMETFLSLKIFPIKWETKKKNLV